MTVNLQTTPWYVNGSTAYTWRRDVTLDRPYYFTDGQLFLTDHVDMPNVFDYVLSAGYLKRGLMATVSSEDAVVVGLRSAEGRGGDVAALWRHPLPVGHRGWQGARPAHRWLYREFRAD